MTTNRWDGVGLEAGQEFHPGCVGYGDQRFVDMDLGRSAADFWAGGATIVKPSDTALIEIGPWLGKNSQFDFPIPGGETDTWSALFFIYPGSSFPFGQTVPFVTGVADDDTKEFEFRVQYPNVYSGGYWYNPISLWSAIDGTDTATTANGFYVEAQHRIQMKCDAGTLSARWEYVVAPGWRDTLVRSVNGVDRLRFGPTGVEGWVQPVFKMRTFITTDTAEWLADPTVFAEIPEPDIFLHNGVDESETVELLGSWNGATIDTVEASNLAIYDEQYGGKARNVTTDITYHTSEWGTYKLDVYEPSTPDAPWVLFAHGGFFMFGDKADVAFDQVFELILRCGWGVISANYPLSPDPVEIAFEGNNGPNPPIAIQHFKRAALWAQANAATYNLDPAKGVWGGHSAGAYLALMCQLTRDRNDAVADWRHNEDATPDPLLNGALLISGPVNAEDAAAQFIGADIAVRSYVGCELEGACPAAVDHNADDYLDHVTEPILYLRAHGDYIINAAQSDSIETAAAGVVGYDGLESHEVSGDHDEIMTYYLRDGIISRWLEGRFA